MKNHSTPSEQESRKRLAAVVAYHGDKISHEGSQLLSNDDPALQMRGWRLLMLGSGLMSFVPLIEAGIMSKSQLMKYLDKCEV